MKLKILIWLGDWLAAFVDTICGSLGVISFGAYRPWWDFSIRAYWSKLILKHKASSGKHVFVVVSEGVYRHDIFGCFTRSDHAIREARRLAQHDKDRYHDYVVVEVPFNRMCQLCPDTTTPASTEEREIYRANKKDPPQTDAGNVGD